MAPFTPRTPRPARNFGRTSRRSSIRTLPRLRQDSPLISYSFLSPLSMSPPPSPKNYFFDGSIGVYQNSDSSKVWIYPTMRRGGRMVYAFDVTTPSAPILKWKEGCPNLTDDTNCSSGFTDIGQTWSIPNVAALKIGGTVGEAAIPIVAVGGGYDNCEDGSPNAACGSAKGSIVYILRADNGSKLASFTTAGRVVADVAFVDLDSDGIPDLAYAVDTRGNIYRISFGLSKSAPLAAASWTSTLIAATTGSNRKFLYAPAVSPAYDSSTGKFYVYLALGSGDREQPLETQYPYANPVLNRFYMYIDDVASTAKADLDSSTAMSDFTAATSCASSLAIPGSGKSGWFMDLDVCGPGATDCTPGATTRGEQTVTSAVIVGGFVAFSTNRAIPRSANVCAPQGEARGYAVNLSKRIRRHWRAAEYLRRRSVGTVCRWRPAAFAGGGQHEYRRTRHIDRHRLAMSVRVRLRQLRDPEPADPSPAAAASLARVLAAGRRQLTYVVLQQRFAGGYAQRFRAHGG